MSIRSTEAQPTPHVRISIQYQGQPANFVAGSHLLHAHLIPEDLSTLHHEHPRQVQPGEFVLEIPALQTGMYDAWLEVTRSAGRHVVEVLDRFPMKLNSAGTPSPHPITRRITLVPRTLAIAPPGRLSHLEFVILLEDAPVSRFGQFVGVQVHSWAVSKDRAFLVHDHAEILGQGLVDAHFTFPRAGDYVIFLQPAIGSSSSDDQLTPVLTYPVTVR